MYLTWYVKVDNKMVGTVVAEDETSALFCAQDRFNFTFESGYVSVERKSQKRKIK